jgi:hypothetical protein
MKLAILTVEGHPSYIVKVGSRLFDGVVTSISKNGVVFTQDTVSSTGISTILKPTNGALRK